MHHGQAATAQGRVNRPLLVALRFWVKVFGKALVHVVELLAQEAPLKLG